MQKPSLSISVLLQAVTALMTLMLVGIFAIYATRALERREQAGRVPSIVDVSYDLFAAVQALRIERGSVNAALAMTSLVDPDLKTEIIKSRVESGRSLDSAFVKLLGISVKTTAPAIGELRESQIAVAELRRKIDAALQQTAVQRPKSLGESWVAANDRLIRAIDLVSSHLESELAGDDSFVSNMIHIKQMVWLVRSGSGGSESPGHPWPAKCAGKSGFVPAAAD